MIDCYPIEVFKKSSTDFVVHYDFIHAVDGWSTYAKHMTIWRVDIAFLLVLF